ncbi:MAG: hypothetical protein ACLUTU_06995 [Blautia faecis]
MNLQKVLDLADRIAENPGSVQPCSEWKKDCHSFYGPSTRTRLSFESAMLSLGRKSAWLCRCWSSPVPQKEKR